MATRRIGLKGSRIQRAFVALNRNMSLPLLITTKVWKQRKMVTVALREACKEFYPLVTVIRVDVFKWCTSKFWWEVVLHPYR